MRRTAALYVFPAALIAALWLRLERPPGGGEALLVVALALLPALVRRGWPQALTVAAAAVVAARVALGASAPWTLLARLRDGTLDYYDVALPFAPPEHPFMHGVLLLAIFGFCLTLGLALAARRPLPAALAVIAGGGWPATLVRSEHDLALGAFLLAAVLVVLAGMRAPGGGRLAPATVAGALVVAAAVTASSAGAVARHGLLDWQSWDFYNRPSTPVSVGYVWDANYAGIHFPERKTVVLRIRGPKRARYWRATTLDTFTHDRWLETLSLRATGVANGLLPPDPLLPARARERRNWIAQEVEVASLRDDHLAGASTPVALDSRSLGPVYQLADGVIRTPRPVAKGQRYRVWSFTPRPTPAQLARLGADYPDAVMPYLDIGRTRPYEFGVPGREDGIERLFTDIRFEELWPYRQLYRTARRVAGEATSPYAAAVAIETWLRATGGFRYDETPPPPGSVPPLADFVQRTKRGYCQHFAGSMALMLRFLGIPARVAAGFTSGQYGHGTWTVTDHDAHAWVEVWFPTYGWLPFDPTPGRGSFASAYTIASDSADALAAIAAAAGFAGNRALNDGRSLGRLLGQGGAVAAPQRHRRGPGFLLVVALVLAGAGLSLGLAKLAARRARYATRNPRRAAAAARRELAGFLADQGLPVRESSTLGDLHALLEAELGVSARAFAAAAGAARFGPPAAAAAPARLARRELRALLRAVRARLTRLQRARGFVSLRSLGLRA